MLRTHIPSLKVILMLRYPIDRLYSLYSQYRRTYSMRHPSQDWDTTTPTTTTPPTTESFEEWANAKLAVVKRILGSYNVSTISWKGIHSLLLSRYHSHDHNYNHNMYVHPNETLTHTPLHALWQREIPSDIAAFFKSMYCPASKKWAKHWVSHLQQSHLMAVTYDRYLAQPAEVMREVSRFLGIERSDWRKITRRKRLPTIKNKPSALVDFFKPLNDELGRLLNVDLSSWNTP